MEGVFIYTTETGKCDKSGSLPTSVFFWWKPIVKPLPASYWLSTPFLCYTAGTEKKFHNLAIGMEK